MRDLNVIEQEIVNDLGSVWNKFLSLHVLNESDDKEFMHGLHNLQRMIMSRPAIEDEINKSMKRETRKHRLP